MPSIEKAVLNLLNFSTIERGEVEDKSLFIYEIINPIVHKIIPLLTIEQLTIIEEINKQNSNKETDSSEFDPLLKLNNFFKASSFTKENIQIIDNEYEIYESLFNQKLEKSMNLDDYSDTNIQINQEIKLSDQNEIQLKIPSLELYLNTISHDEILLDVEETSDNLFLPTGLDSIISWIDSIESSLFSLLKTLSNKLNKVLISNEIIHKGVNDEILICLSENNFLVSNPSPFLILLDLSSFQLINDDKNFRNINPGKVYLLNINQTEMEFDDLRLNLLRGKIMEFKNNLRNLHKKEKYWNSKRFNSEKFLSSIS